MGVIGIIPPLLKPSTGTSLPALDIRTETVGVRPKKLLRLEQVFQIAEGPLEQASRPSGGCNLRSLLRIGAKRSNTWQIYEMSPGGI